MQGNTPSYEAVCKYVGQLFLETRHTLEQLNQKAADREAELTRELVDMERQRDDALKLLHTPKA